MSRFKPMTWIKHILGLPSARQTWACLIMSGLLLQGGLPGFDLALRGDLSSTLFGAKAANCHALSSDQTLRNAGPVQSDEEDNSFSHGCCLVCQAAQAAKGALPSPTFTLPTAGTASLPAIASARAHVHGLASLHKLPRAPPAAVA
ncbi:conserved hypothetical protein [Candidatus Terasakiella magnetica]|nr:conserved hypothetical protein [Candidatus Terasakiella magnetica]